MKSTATSSVLLLVLCLGINAPAYCAQEQQAPGEVLNLEEAAALLKVDKKELESAAQHGKYILSGGSAGLRCLAGFPRQARRRLKQLLRKRFHLKLQVCRLR